ncbi:MAG: hypothetical protein ACOY90_18075 [Candidatus Zhuqueibacterota bacterium]
MAKSKQIRYNKNFLSALAVVLLISFFVIFFLISRIKVIPENDSAIIGNFIEWFGVLYGVLLALVVVEVWQRHSLVNNEIDREADALVLLLKTTRYLQDKKKVLAIAKLIYDYSRIMLRAKHPRQYSNPKVNSKLDEIHREIGSVLQDDRIPLPFSLEMMRYINDAIDIRGDWMSLVRERMPKGIWVLLLFTSVWWVLGFFGLNIENFTIAFTLCSVATFTVSAIIFIVNDLDDPISGLWKTRFESFDILRKEAKNLLEQRNQ